MRLRSEYKLSVRPDRLWLLRPRTRVNNNFKDMDTVNGADVDILKRTFLDTIKSKREKNEFKIKRIRDLAEQIENEVIFLSDMKDNYSDRLNTIRGRFDLDDYPENQKNKPQDQAEVSNITKVPIDKGILVENGETFYLIKSFNPRYGSIYFDGMNPPVKTGDVIIISNGKNNGEKTVSTIRNQSSITVLEPLVEEINSKSKAKISDLSLIQVITS